MSMLQSGTMQTLIVDTDLGVLLRSTVEQYGTLAQKKNLNLEYRSDGEIITAIDTKLVSRAVGEILSNAIRFTEKGSVEVKVRRSATDPELVDIVVSDTGIGIAPENHSIVFESFHQVSQGYGRSYEGNGLGLTLARLIMGLFGGQISLQSEPGKGSTFILSLPIRTKGQEKFSGQNRYWNTDILPENSGKSRARKSPRVLLVEDNEENIILTRHFCEGLCEIDEARDAEAALKKSEEKNYDIILMDINLGPGMDGLNVAKELRKTPAYRKTPIVALTGYTQLKDRERILSGGCTHYLGKPFSGSSIRDLIHSLSV